MVCRMIHWYGMKWIWYERLWHWPIYNLGNRCAIIMGRNEMNVYYAWSLYDHRSWLQHWLWRWLFKAQSWIFSNRGMWSKRHGNIYECIGCWFWSLSSPMTMSLCIQGHVWKETVVFPELIGPIDINKNECLNCKLRYGKLCFMCIFSTQQGYPRLLRIQDDLVDALITVNRISKRGPRYVFLICQGFVGIIAHHWGWSYVSGLPSICRWQLWPSLCYGICESWQAVLRQIWRRCPFRDRVSFVGDTNNRHAILVCNCKICTVYYIRRLNIYRTRSVFNI